MSVVLSLCDRTGVMVQPWLEAGYRCMIVDVQHPAGSHTEGLLTKVGADITTWLPPLDEYAACFAFPPCTHLANSGARWFKAKGLGALIEGLTLVEHICEWTGAPWLLENPNGTCNVIRRNNDNGVGVHEQSSPVGWWSSGGSSKSVTCRRVCTRTADGGKRGGA